MDRAQVADLLAMLPILQAYADGREVQYRVVGAGNEGKWQDSREPSFKTESGMFGLEWRLKPIPIEAELWVCIDPGKSLWEVGAVHSWGKNWTPDPAPDASKWRKATFREVLKED